MKRVICLGVVASAVVFLVATATHSQTYNSSRGGGGSGGGSYRRGGGSGVETGVSGRAGSGLPDNAPPLMVELFQRHEAQMQEMRRRWEETRRQAEAARNRAIQESLHATDEQWRRLKPKLDRIDRLKTEASVAVDLSSFGTPPGFQGGGTMFGSTWGGGSAAAGSGSGFGSGPQAQSRGQSKSFDWGNTGPKSPMEMTPGEVLCDELGRLLQDPGAPASEVAQKVESLRKIRMQAREDLAKARSELRAQILLPQEPVLIAMGYLD
jgi:uncharacterized membrane protein